MHSSRLVSERLAGGQDRLLIQVSLGGIILFFSIWIHPGQETTGAISYQKLFVVKKNAADDIGKPEHAGFKPDDDHEDGHCIRVQDKLIY